MVSSSETASMPRLGSVEDQIRAVLYGNCIGDALGLLTEFMSKEQAEKIYGKIKKLAYTDKVEDMHRSRFPVGDWTDDSDQMIIILQSVTDNKGKVSGLDFAKRLKKWCSEGFQELGDKCGMGIGLTTGQVMSHHLFLEQPHKAAEEVWRSRKCTAAPNGGVMRTSALGCLASNDLRQVTLNTLEICKVTHHDPRCQASCVVVTTAISVMLQREEYFNVAKEEYDVEGILEKACDNAVQSVFKDLEDCAEKEEELRKYMFSDSKDLKDLHLGEEGIGYTYKCMGCGCWALRQNNFEVALQQIVMEAGDADTNGAVAGALLGCKLGLQALHVKRHKSGWLKGLIHKDWMDKIIAGFLDYVNIPQYRVMSQAEIDIVFKESRV